MALNVDLRDFLDEQGNVVELTELAERVFTFVIKIVSAISASSATHGTHSNVEVNLQCNTRAPQLSCDGRIEAKCNTSDVIEWHCDTCTASGTISHWKTSLWDKQKRVLH